MRGGNPEGKGIQSSPAGYDIAIKRPITFPFLYYLIAITVCRMLKHPHKADTKFNIKFCDE